MDEDSGRRREKVSMYRWFLVSYDVTRRKRSVAVRVAEYVYGRKVKVATKRGIKMYRYPGMISKPSVERIGQSVLLMWEREAEDFHKFLVKLGVPHTRFVTWIDF